MEGWGGEDAGLLGLGLRMLFFEEGWSLVLEADWLGRKSGR